jgi:hypothetical protein
LRRVLERKLKWSLERRQECQLIVDDMENEQLEVGEEREEEREL